MKTKILIAISCCLLITQAYADNFDRWFAQVQRESLSRGMIVTNSEAWREWFWLYCYQPKEPSMTPKQAVAWTLKEDSKSK